VDNNKLIECQDLSDGIKTHESCLKAIKNEGIKVKIWLGNSFLYYDILLENEDNETGLCLNKYRKLLMRNIEKKLHELKEKYKKL
jgi:hypothetical protein